MAEKDVSKIDTTDFSTAISDYSVSPEETDGPSDTGETYYDNENWNQYLGYYKTIPELAAAIDSRAIWLTAKGYETNPITELALMKLKGFGKDTFLSIVRNLVRVYHIGGDAFAEIIRDDDGNLVNLKPLDAGKIRIVVNKQGIITRYEQTKQTEKGRKGYRTFQPEEMFHLARNRVADEIHGTSIIPTVEQNILMLNEALADYRKLLHRNVAPVRLWKVDSDDTTQLNTVKTEIANGKGNFEDIVVPKGTVETEIIAVPTNATLNPLPWIRELNQRFWEAVGVPKIVVGNSQDITEAAGKIVYLGYENSLRSEQLFLENEILAQLNLEINLLMPASLQNELISDTDKEGSMQAATPEDTAVQPEQPQQQAAAPIA